MKAATSEIVVRKGEEVLSQRRLLPGEYVVGRAEEADIRIDVAMISRRHAILTVEDDGVSVEDLGSANGTYLDGEPVTAAVRINPSQRVQIGEASLEVCAVPMPAEEVPTTSPATELRRLLEGQAAREQKYAIQGTVAQGGMGAILSATDAAISRTVAMKVMLRNDSREGMTRFIREAKITGQLEHPNIVPIYELSVDHHGQLFYTMKFVKGTTLMEVVDRLRGEDPLTVEKYTLARLLGDFQKICDAVAFAHSKGIIHRDLKPQNIMLGDYGEVLVMDWGIAKFIDQKGDGPEVEEAAPGTADFEVTKMGTVIGSPRFMAPEQARGEALDERSDLYALGAILYTLLCLEPPVAGTHASEIIAKVADGDVAPLPRTPKPAIHLPGGRVPDSLHAMTTKAMAFVPADRYASVGEFQADLLAYQDGFATRAENAGLFRVVGLALKRRRREAAILACSLAALLCTGVYAFVRVERARLLAERQSAVATNALIEVEREKEAAQKAAEIAEREKADADNQRKTADVRTKEAQDAKQLAETERHSTVEQHARAEEALMRLRATAPTFRSQAQSLLEAGNFDGAIAKISFALDLEPESADDHLFKANLLEAQEKLDAAESEYRTVLTLRPSDEQATRNLTLCQSLRQENGADGALSAAVEKKLLAALLDQKRLIEAAPLNRRFSAENASAAAALHARLKFYTAQVGWKETRIKNAANGLVNLDLSEMQIGDLRDLVGLPLDELDLSRSNVTRLDGLKETSFHRLLLAGTSVAELPPLAGKPVTYLDISKTPVRDLSPLSGSPLESLIAEGSQVSDLRPLAGLPLQELVLTSTPCGDLSPLSHLPLRKLSTTNTSVTTLEPLRGLPLQEIKINSLVTDFEPLRGMPLRFLWASGSSKVKSLEPLLACTQLETIGVFSGLPGLPLLCQHPSLKQITLVPPTDSKDQSRPTLTKQEFVTRFAPHFALSNDKLPALRKLVAARHWSSSPEEAIKLDSDGTLLISLRGARLGDLNAFRGLPIKQLNVRDSDITSIAPLTGCSTLEDLVLSGTKVRDLTPLIGKPLKVLIIPRTPVTSLEPLRGSPLACLRADDCRELRDLSPLGDCQQLEMLIYPSEAHGLESLRKLPNLSRIDNKAEFDFEDFDTRGTTKSAKVFWAEWDRKVK